MLTRVSTVLWKAEIRRPQLLGGGEGGIIPDREFLLTAVGRCWNVLRNIGLSRYPRESLILQRDEARSNSAALVHLVHLEHRRTSSWTINKLLIVPKAERERCNRILEPSEIRVASAYARKRWLQRVNNLSLKNTFSNAYC